MTDPQALWHIDRAHSAIREAETGTGILIRAEASLISLGTERLVASGGVPEDLYEDMAVPHQAGSFHFPVKYGYSLVGRVDEPDHLLHGQLVHLLHPHQTFCRVAESAVFVVPEGIPARRATLASNLETAVTAVWDSDISIGDRVLVVGFGLIGALTAHLIAGIPGVYLEIGELRDDRRDFAQSLGYPLWDGRTGGFDVVVHCSASSAGLRDAIRATGREGRILELSWYGDREVQVPLGGSFHSQRKQIRASQVSSISPDRLPRWDFRRRKEVVFDLLANDEFDRYLTHEVKFAELPDFFHHLRQGIPAGMAWTVSYSD